MNDWRLRAIARRKECPIAYIPIGTLEWHGWLSDIGVKTVIFHDEGPNDQFVMDSLEAIVVPEVSHWLFGAAMLGISGFVVTKQIRERKLALARAS